MKMGDLVMGVKKIAIDTCPCCHRLKDAGLFVCDRCFKKHGVSRSSKCKRSTKSRNYSKQVSNGRMAAKKAVKRKLGARRIVRRGRMNLLEVQEGSLVRVVGGNHWHPQIINGAVFVLKKRTGMRLELNLLRVASTHNDPNSMRWYKAQPMADWGWNFMPGQQEEQIVETMHSYAELSQEWPNEDWPIGFNAEFIVRPNYELKLEGVVLEPEARASIVSVLSTHKKSVQEKVFGKWGFGSTIEKGKGMALLFYGPPGTGKTKCAEAIAQDFGMKVKLIDPAMLWSSEPGAAERTIKEVFASAQKNHSGMLLLFDECEVLIADRAQTGQILAAQTNALLSALERFDGISIFTTNRTPVLDPAFERRLQLKLEFPKPNKALREAIWRALVPKEAPLAEDVCFRTLAASELSGGHIKNVLLNAARRAAVQEYESINMQHLTDALLDELNGMAAFAEEDDTPKMGGGMGMTRSAARGLEIKSEVTRVNKLIRKDGEEVTDGKA